jgi:pimeloyl-ACP methyl ester carboxylesterase
MKKVIPFLLGRYLNMLARIAPATAGHHGFRIFCYPFRTPLKRYHREFMDTAKQEIIDVNGIRIQLYRWGTGDRKILLLHGWQSHTYRWKNYVDQFPPDQYSVYSIDAPGHGLSSGNYLTVPVYSQVVEEVIAGIGNIFAVISHSLGAFTTLYTLDRLPQLPVQKLVLLASPGEATEFIHFFSTALKLNEKSVRHILDHFEHEITEPITFFSARRFAESIRQPGLIIHDKQDDETSYEHSLAIHRAWKGSELIVTDGLGHNLKSPDILRKVFEFVDTIPSEVPMIVAQ